MFICVWLNSHESELNKKLILKSTIEVKTYKQCCTNRVLTRRLYWVYVFRYQNRVNSEVNSISGKIGMFNEFDTSELG